MFLNCQNILGESPIYHSFQKSFFWIDILDNKLYQFNDEIYKIELPFSPCCIQQENQNLLMCSETQIGIFDLRINKFQPFLKMDFPNNIRFNDGRKDNNGIFYIGTMDKNEKEFCGHIYKLENQYLNPIKENIGISNGIAFDKDNNFYFADSLKKTIYKSHKIIKVYETESPDGAIFDKNNKYLSCLWGGSRIDIFQDDIYQESIPLPVSHPTCCAEFEDKLLITSSNLLNKESGKPILLPFF